MTGPLRASCDGCGCWTGARHSVDCPRAVCEATGQQWLDCPCPKKPDGPYDLLPPVDGFPHQVGRYQGEWLFEAAARKTGMWVRWDPTRERWERCRANEPGAGPDVGRIVENGLWDPRMHEWRLRRAVLYVRLSTKKLPDPADREVPTTGEDWDGWVQDQFDLAAYPLRLWALEAGFEIVAETFDMDRLGRGWKNALGLPGEVVAVNDQNELGGTNKVRRRSIETAKEAGKQVLSRKLWENRTTAPASEQLRWSWESRAVIGPPED